MGTDRVIGSYSPTATLAFSLSVHLRPLETLDSDVIRLPLKRTTPTAVLKILCREGGLKWGR